MNEPAKRAAWIDAVWTDDGPRPANARYVGLAIANHAGSNGSNAYPSERKLAAATLLDRRTVRRMIATLVESGWLTAESKGTGQFGRPITRYQLSLPGIGASSVPMSSKGNGASSDPMPAPHRDITGTPNGTSNGTCNGTSNGASSVPQPITHNPQPITQEGTLARSGNPDFEKESRGLAGKENPDGYIADLDLGAEAVAIVQGIRPGADPAAVVDAFRTWGAKERRSARGWRHSLETFAKGERLSDEERRAEQAAMANRVGPRQPGESAATYAARANPPPDPDALRRINERLRLNEVPHV